MAYIVNDRETVEAAKFGITQNGYFFTTGDKLVAFYPHGNVSSVKAIVVKAKAKAKKA